MTTDSRFLDLVEGANNGLWITNVKFEGADPKEKTPRKKIVLTLAALPTKEAFVSPYTQIKVYVPSKEDTVQAKIMLDDKIKRIIFPLVGFEPGVDEAGNKKRISFGEMTSTLKTQIEAYDFAVNATVKLTEGKSLDKNGDLIMFSDVLGIEVTGYEEKGEYVSDMDYDT